MPRAGHDRPLQRAIDERSSLMRADCVDHQDLSIHIEQAIHSALELDFLGRPNRKLSKSRQLHESRHPILSRSSIPWVDSVAIATGVTRQAARLLYFIKPETVGKSGARGGPLGTKGGSLPTLSK